MFTQQNMDIKDQGAQMEPLLPTVRSHSPPIALLSADVIFFVAHIDYIPRASFMIQIFGGESDLDDDK